MADIVYKTTYSPEEIEKNKQIYLEKKESIIGNLKEIVTLLEGVGDAPFTGDVRQKIMTISNTIVNHRLFDRLDTASFQYFEAKEAPQKV